MNNSIFLQIKYFILNNKELQIDEIHHNNSILNKKVRVKRGLILIGCLNTLWLYVVNTRQGMESSTRAKKYCIGAEI